MARDLPSLPIFADEIISALGSDLVRDRSILDEGEYPSVAIRLSPPSDHHAILLRDHHYTIAISLPAQGQGLWHAAARAEWSITEGMRKRIAHYAEKHANAISMADVIVKLKPMLASFNDGAQWRVSFPGTPVPSEAWIREQNGNERAIGLFQEDRAVKVVIWAGGGMLSLQITSAADFAHLPAFITTSLREQVEANEAAKKEKERLDALPKPTVEEVRAKILAGNKYSCGGRYHTAYYEKDGRVFVDICDEGHYETNEASDHAIQLSIDLYPDVFRH